MFKLKYSCLRPLPEFMTAVSAMLTADFGADHSMAPSRDQTKLMLIIVCRDQTEFDKIRTLFDSTTKPAPKKPDLRSFQRVTT